MYVTADEFKKIKEHAIKKIKVSTTQPIIHLADTYDKAKAFITLKAIQAIKILFPNLDIIDFKFHDAPKELKPRGVLFTSVYTRPENNHPFIIFAMLRDTNIYLVRPFGRNDGQIDLNVYETFADPRFIDQMSSIEYYALYLLFAESSRIRKYEMLHSRQHSLIECFNIKQCRKKYDEIMKSKSSKTEKSALIQKYNTYYIQKAVVFLTKYFDLLESKNYKEAYDFLRGGTNNKYFGKQRLDTFFINSKNIIGHLQIFISIYEFMYSMIDRYTDAHKRGI